MRHPAIIPPIGIIAKAHAALGYDCLTALEFLSFKVLQEFAPALGLGPVLFNFFIELFFTAHFYVASLQLSEIRNH